mgnify:CR=1 FL=1
MRARCASSPMPVSSEPRDSGCGGADRRLSGLTPATTTAGLFGERLRYTQPARGFRSGLEPVLLAAAVPARPGQRVLEAGCAAGAGLLCLAARVPSVEGVGVDCDLGLVRLAEANAAANGLAGLRFAVADVLGGDGDADLATVAAFGPVHHAFANPPYHPSSGTPSPDAARRLAKQAAPGTVAVWTAALARCVLPKGTVTLILPAAALPEALAAMAAARCAARALLPLWPRAGREARLVLVQGVRDGRSPFRIGAGLVLHGPDGFTPAAEAVLRDGAALPMD